MPIEYAQWAIENQVMVARAVGVVSRAEMVEHNRIVVAYLDTSDTNLHLLLDDTAMIRMEPPFPEVQSIIKFQHHNNLGWTIHISNNRVIRHFSNLMARISRIQYRQFVDFNEGLNFLRQQEPYLAWDKLQIPIIDADTR